jgi:TonB family protein
LVLGLVVGTAGPGHSSGLAETVITTKLVRLGKERPQDLLPRKQRMAPPAKKAVSLDPASRRAEPAPKSVSAKERINEMSKLSNALSRLKEMGDEDPEGQEDGSPDGEVSSLAQALIGNKYATEIYACVKKHYAIEGLPPAKVKSRMAVVFVRVKTDGTFFDFKIEKSSGLKAFDRAVERSIRRCGKVSPPPVEILKQVREDGIEFEFRP